MLAKKVTYFGEFSCLKSSCITIKCFCCFFVFFERYIHAFVAKVSADFRPPCWCPSRWAPTWRLYNLGKTFRHVSPIRKIAVTWILARVFAYLPSLYFQILDLIYWTVLIFYFDQFWMAWHWKPAIHVILSFKVLRWSKNSLLFFLQILKACLFHTSVAKS